MDFSIRSYQPELIDNPDVPFEEIRKNMQELDVINTHLGGHAISIRGLRKLLEKNFRSGQVQRHICEIGCGGGDNLLALSAWCLKNNLQATFTGIDINPNCITYAKSVQASMNAKFIESDYRQVQFRTKPDIIFSSLFCHHFTDEELILMLRWMQGHATVGFFINDLHRHPLAYHAIKMITSVFSSSRLVKHDAPLSVKRGFRKEEWISLFEKAGVHPMKIQWQWAFRWLIVHHKTVNQ